MYRHVRGLVLGAMLFAAALTQGEEPLHRRIDRHILAQAEGRPVSPQTTDAAFLRRVYLDTVGTIPTIEEAHRFLEDPSPDKRAKLIDALLNDPRHPARMRDLFHVLLMERLGEHPQWSAYLLEAFKTNKPWDQMARDMLGGSSEAGATFFLSKRLENYGQNPVDYPALTRDIGRLFLGKDFQCNQCHDHLFIDEYKQSDYQGLFAFVQNVSLDRQSKTPAVTEMPTSEKIEFQSVFNDIRMEVGPRLPGLKEIEIPAFKKGEEWLVPPDRKKRTAGVPKFSTLKQLAEGVTSPENPDFAKNFVNRMWFVLMGRGLVHPLDLHHAENPPSHPELLTMLARDFIQRKYDIRWLLREMMLSETYQRSTVLPEGVEKFEPATFLTAHERRLSPEQLVASMLQATGHQNKDSDEVKKKFLAAYANPAREPEVDYNPSLRAVLFLLNDPLILQWLQPKNGNFADQLSKEKDNNKIAEMLYLGILTRRPTEEEVREVTGYLKTRAERREMALGHLMWALLSSTEFGVNH